MKSNFVIWKHKRMDNVCSLDELKGLEKIYRLRQGISLASTFPEKVTYLMNLQNPYNTLLVDSLFNTQSLLVVSKKLMEFFVNIQIEKVECLPIIIINHKGKPISDPYYILNQIDHVDCLKLDQCGGRWSRIAKDEMTKMEHFIIDESRIPTDRVLFRCKHYSTAIILNKKIADEIDKNGFTGMRWLELGNYPEN